MYMYIHKLDAELCVQKENVLSLQLYHSVILLTVKYFLVFFYRRLFFSSRIAQLGVYIYMYMSLLD